MLLSLSIQNFVLIDKLSFEVSKGLTSFTGETGAGKSIILGALGFVLGNRANAKLIKDASKPVVVSTVFDIERNKALRTVLQDKGIDDEGQVILRRSTYPDGRTKAFINDIPTSISSLQELGKLLIEICGQHDQKGLLDAATHLGILDEYGGYNSEISELSEKFAKWKDLREQLIRVKEDKEKAASEKSFLEHIVDEIGEFDPKPGEEQELESRRKLLRESTQIQEVVDDTLTTLNQGEVLSKLYSLQKGMDKYPQVFENQSKSLEGITIDLEEVYSSLEQIASQFGSEGMDLETLEDRLFGLKNIARKYGVESDELRAFLEQTKEQLELLDSSSFKLQELEKEVSGAETKYIEIAYKVSKLRRVAAEELKSQVLGELSELKMNKADFKVEFEKLEQERWGEKGIEKVQFVVRTNPGTPYGSMNKIASGGELSRFMLAFKVAIARVRSLPTVIFDEIDTGIGGAVSDAVGKKLGELSKGYQIIVVTHQPQVAAYANTHMLVEKKSGDETAEVSVRQLSPSEKHEEIARMLSGQDITEESLAAAKSLIKAAA